MDQLQQMKALLETAEQEADKFYNKGNNAAGTRLRKAMQDMKELAQKVRNDVTAAKKD